MARSPARRAALAALLAIDDGIFLGPALQRSDRIAGEERRERDLSRRLVRGVLQTRARLDWIMEQLLHRKNPHGLDPRTRNILRLGLYQILFLSGIPPHAAVNETVRLARREGGEPAARLVNGILRRVLREGEPSGLPSIEDDPVGHLSIAESFPRWLVSRWVKRLGVEETAARLRAGNRPPPLSLRVLDQRKVDSVFAELEAEGIEVVRSSLAPTVLLLRDGGNPARLAPFQRGDAIIQDEGMALVGTLAYPVPSVCRLLDLCAAPGGKLLALASTLSADSLAIGIDISPRRMERLRENKERLGLQSLRLVAADGLALPFRDIRFSIVLLDAPCSGLGTLARKPDLRWRLREEDIPRLAKLSLRLLLSAATVVEPGGILVYSTCTTEPEENEETVRRFLERERGFRLERPELPLPDRALAPDGTLRLLPEKHGCDGVFAARLRRIDR